ncbi:tRNA 2-selenouridine(34) synthase MnmH [Alkalicoccus chagannorensis]|uniref:tRNA 2-selenouridine(34) synthase MnmH n=1 Tax=Alkalicoccus chagannorensis TaxID=427072 RepID=UPI00041C601F|nr:tRNA 2-selenouridine(34) synthase MnmH [Alkalicoccus chagannorensis]
MMAKLTFEQWNPDDMIVIDVRAPEEFQEFALPGSVNIPLFTDDERAVVGTAYKQESPERAKELGIQFFSEKLPEFYEKVTQLQEERQQPLLIACARGGMRSGTFVSLMQSIGFDVYQLEGGIRSVRRWVQAELDRLGRNEWHIVVLGGYTGTQKTIYLEALEQEGFPVLNLEQLAGHRGSIFGHIGMQTRSQKMFEWLLVRRLRDLEQESWMIVEAESRRIGRVLLPEWLDEEKDRSVMVELADKMENRVAYLLEEYSPDDHEAAFNEALEKLERRLPQTWKTDILEAASMKEYSRLFELLLEHYYDPRYSHKDRTGRQREVIEVPLHDCSEKQALERIQEKLKEASSVPAAENRHP